MTFEYIFDGGFPLRSPPTDRSLPAISPTAASAPIRWTQATGVVALGPANWGGGAGMTVMSADGTKIAATIGSLDSTVQTRRACGRWARAGRS